MNEIGIVGAGAWGTALALLASRAGHAVSLWARDPARRAEIARTRRNGRLPGATLPPNVALAHDPSLPRAEILLLAVPVAHFSAVAETIEPAGRPLVAASKGMERGTGRLPHEILTAIYPQSPVAVLAGPNFALEIAAGQPAAAVLAASDPALRRWLLGLLSAPAFRVYGNTDPLGAAIGGAAKNVIAIAAGAVIGAGLSENARAAVLTRGLAELGRLTTALGGRLETSFGLSGLSDLVLTATSEKSRNFRFGLALGRGAEPAAILTGLEGTTEGVSTAAALARRAEAAGCEVPIVSLVARLLDGRTTLAAAISELLSRPQRDE
ncbi:MAG: NAD(P)H-dependent glycerol-3-phosphate dehydrogenase [Acetobacteraceae bacterium]